jgi:hypothetical protein
MEPSDATAEELASLASEVSVSEQLRHANLVRTLTHAVVRWGGYGGRPSGLGLLAATAAGRSAARAGLRARLGPGPESHAAGQPPPLGLCRSAALPAHRPCPLTCARPPPPFWPCCCRQVGPARRRHLMVIIMGSPRL